MLSKQRVMVLVLLCLASVGWADPVEELLQETGVSGGLVVQIGCGDGKMTAALGARDGFLVHAVERNSQRVDATRSLLKEKGVYGKASVDALQGSRLPYEDGLVNLVLAEDLGKVPFSEVTRVLRPGGVACVKKNGAWEKTVKPWPEEIDEWTHYLHGPDNNAVANDSVVDIPRRLHWLGGPKFARAHEQLASMGPCVTTEGRIFYIIDDTPRADIRFESKWSLVARDAFNGVVLWKRAVPTWVDQLRRFRSGPAETAFRLVAQEGKVYVTLGIDVPVSILDAATGKTVAVCEGTGHARQMLRLGDKILTLVDTRPETTAKDDSEIRRGLKPAPGVRAIVASDAATGKTLWREKIETFVHPTLAAKGSRLFYQTKEHLICLNPDSGKELWRAPATLQLTGHELGWESPTLVVGDKAVYSADFKKIFAYALSDGKEIWNAKSSAGYNSPPDVFLIDDLLWLKGKGMVALDPATGEVKKQFPTTGGYMHDRCYRNKATDRFFLLGEQGVQYIDRETGDISLHHWIRGTCQYGILPANGQLYITPDSCACNMKTKLAGFWSLAPERTEKPKGREGKRLLKGPAFGKVEAPKSSTEAWPVHRHDFARSGMTDAAAPTALAPAWRAEIGGRLTGVTVADGKAFVASIDTHTVHALNAQSGKPAWTFTAGARVDSPPTIYKGLALFGSADGWLYALRASDGALAWRFRAAPEERRTFVNGQLESVWPVHGSVLVEDGKIIVSAGRSSYLDGGIRLLTLDPATGRKLTETAMYSPDSETGKQPSAPANARKDVRGALSDILLSDGGSVYMRHVKLDLETGSHSGKGQHMFSPIGLLDDTWWHRGYWTFNDEFIAHWSGWWKVGNIAPAGRILSYDQASIFGYGRDKYPSGNTGQWRGGEKYRLFASDRPAASAPAPKPVSAQARRQAGKKKKPAASAPAKTYRWTTETPFYVRAMVVADKTMFIAGPPEMVVAEGVGEEALLLKNSEEAVAAWKGEKGGHLWTVSTSNGQSLAKYKLDAPPVFDGMAATPGRLYLVTQDGALTCYGKGEAAGS